MKRLDLTEEGKNEADERERSLVLAAQAGDAAAFRELYQDYRERVYSSALYSTGDDSQATCIARSMSAFS